MASPSRGKPQNGFAITKQASGSEENLMDKIKIAHIITKLELGGAQKVVIYTASHLNKSRYSSIFISGTGGVLDDDVKNNPEIKSFFIPELIREINPVRDVIALVKIKRLLKNEKVNMIHTHSSKAGILGRWAARLAGIDSIVHTFHGFGFHDFQNPVVRNFFIFVERVTAKITGKLVFVSRANIKKARASRIGSEKQYVLVRAGIDIRKFSDCRVNVAEKKKSLGIEQDAPVVGMIACFKHQKNIMDYLAAANLVRIAVPEVKFLLVGDGQLRGMIEKRIRELDLEGQFILTGWRDDVHEIIQTFNVLVSTSLWEGLPCTFLEAMSVSKPIVSTNVDGVGDVIEDGVNGFLVSLPGGHVEKIAEYVIKLLKDKELAARMGRSGNSKLKEEFDIDRVVRGLEKVYESMVKDK